MPSVGRRSYEITIAGRVDDLASAFAPHHVRVEGGHSVVEVVDADQAGLFGAIGMVEQLGLELHEVRIVRAPR